VKDVWKIEYDTESWCHGKMRQKYNRKNEKLFLRCNEMMKEYEAASDEYVGKKRKQIETV
jgi:hypothetical protein